jgi:cytochrome P450
MTDSMPVRGTRPLLPRSREYLRDPYAQLQALRAQGPCYVDPGSGHWFLLGYDEVCAGLSQITRSRPQGPDRHSHFPSNPFSFDGPRHTEPRSLIAPTFLRRATAKFRERAQSIVDSALSGKERGCELRVVEELGFPLPYHITCDLLGVPDVDNRDELREWTWKSLELIDAFLPDERLKDNLEASGHLAEHMAGVVEWKRKHLGDDVLSAVIVAADEGKILRPHQIIPFVHTLYLAGMHTTVNMTALSLNTLLGRREQWERLLAKPELLENAIDEVLRFESTAQYMCRTTESDVEIEGIQIPRGTYVVCWIASANRDEKKWGATANEVDITRANARQHIAFGKGPHVCIGSWLAKLELETAVGTIAKRFPKSVLPEQELVWASNVIRGPEELIVELRP